MELKKYMKIKLKQVAQVFINLYLDQIFYEKDHPFTKNQKKTCKFISLWWFLKFLGRCLFTNV